MPVSSLLEFALSGSPSDPTGTVYRNGDITSIELVAQALLPVARRYRMHSCLCLGATRFGERHRHECLCHLAGSRNKKPFGSPGLLGEPKGKRNASGESKPPHPVLEV